MADEILSAYGTGVQAPDFTGTAEPFALFETWFAEAKSSELNDPEAMALATVDGDGLPNVRMVLLKGIDGPGRPDRGFVFYTNVESAKGREVLGQGKAALCFHWKSMRRQIRVRGAAAPVDDCRSRCVFRLPCPRQPHRRVGLAAVEAAGKPLCSGEGGRRCSRRGIRSAKFRGRRIGRGSASCRSRSSSGTIGRSACMIVLSSDAAIRMKSGPGIACIPELSIRRRGGIN